MHLGNGAEDMAFSGGGGEGDHLQGFQRLWGTPGDGYLHQIPREGDLGDGRRLDGGDEELGSGKDGADEDVADTHQVGSNASGVRLIF